MIDEKELLCRFDILSIIYQACKKRKIITKEQVILLHYLLRNRQLKIASEIDNLARFNKISIFNICNYDFNINRLVLNGYISFEIKGSQFYYKITFKGEEFIDKLASVYPKIVIELLKQIFLLPLDEDQLRKEVIPHVNVLR